jgi:hypothetical protein
MAARPFAKHTGSIISGTNKTGNISAVVPSNINTFDFASTGLKWYNGPEETGHIISFEGASRITPDGTYSTLNFVRSADLTDQSFVDLVAGLAGQSFINTTNALAWLSSNGYHTTFEVAVGTTFGYTWISGSSFPISSPGTAVIVIDNPTAYDKYIWLKGSSTYYNSGTNSGSASSTGLSGSPISMNNSITASGQTFNSGSYITIPANTLNSQFSVTMGGSGQIQLVYTDANTPTKTNIPSL